MKNCILLLTLSVAIGLLASCTTARSLNAQEELAANTGSSSNPVKLSANEILVVGSIRFRPEIVYEKHYLRATLKSGQPQVVLATDAQIVFAIGKDGIVPEVGLYLPGAIAKYGHYAIQGEVFIARVLQAPVLFMKGFGLQINESYTRPKNGIYGSFFVDVLAAEYKGIYKISLPDKAKAIYIGCFQIDRNEAYEPTGFKIVDEYDIAKAKLSAKYPGLELVRADIVNVDTKK